MTIAELLPSFPLERSARIAASLDAEPDMRIEILRASELSEQTWETIDDHWQEAILQDVQAGRGELRAAWDEAYVGRIEEDRGPIAPSDVAALIVAEERGNSESAAVDLGIPEDAVLPIHRHWQRRTSRDATLAGAVRSAIAAGRRTAPAS